MEFNLFKTMVERINEILNVADFYELHPIHTNFDTYDKDRKNTKKQDNSKSILKLKRNFLKN